MLEMKLVVDFQCPFLLHRRIFTLETASPPVIELFSAAIILVRIIVILMILISSFLITITVVADISADDLGTIIV